MIATSGFLTALQCTPDPLRQLIQRSPRSPSWFKGPYF